jgi:hypothetical protein
MSLKSEREILAKYGARPHLNSGRGTFQKGDGSDEGFVYDVKEAKSSFTINRSVWSKICTDAFRVSPYKEPALILVIDGVELVVIDGNAFRELKERYDND